MSNTADVTATGGTVSAARIVAPSATVGLTLLVAGSWVARTLVAVAHGTPRLFPDEYIYAELGRSLGHGSLAIRGQPAHFPALLEPLLAAPLWRLAGDDVELGYRLVQGMHALAVSLVAIPVYLIARRLALSTGWSLGCAALALLFPAGILSTYVMADAVAWPLALGAVAAGLAALERPAWTTQVLFLALAGLAAFARVQYAVLPLAYLAAALVLERLSLRRTVRQHATVAAPLGAALLVAAAAGPGHVLGYYSGVLHLDVSAIGLGRWLAVDLFLLAFATGVALAPGAIVGIVAAAFRPRSRAEHAFGLLAGMTVLALLAEATLYASNGSERFQERYLLVVLPLVPLGFSIWARRLDSRSTRYAVVPLAVAVAVVAAAVPISTFDQLTGNQDSPALQGVAWVERQLGVGSTGLATALAITALAALAVLAAWRPRPGVPAAALGCGVALVLLASLSVVGSVDAATRAKRTLLAANAGWIDATGLTDVSILQTPFSSRPQISAQLFWNRSLARILQMEDSSTVDSFGSVPTRVAPDGRILAAGEAVSGPLLVTEYASYAVLDDAMLVRRTQNSSLWSGNGTPRMTALVAGRYLDGWLSIRNRITIWPDGTRPREGVLRMVLRLPPAAPRSTVDVVGPGFRRAVVVAYKQPRTLELPLAHTGPWTVSIHARRAFLTNGGRLVTVMASPPKVIETP